MIDKEKIKEFENQIDSFDKFVISMHANPDGDTFGSALAMYLILKKLGKEVSVVSPDKYPDFLDWMPAAENVKVYITDGKEAKEAFSNAECILCLDFNASHRVYHMQKQLEKPNKYRIMIDHHVYPDEDFFDLLFSHPEFSSTAELLYSILESSRFNGLIDKDIAENIFVGIMTDTGSFSHSCNRSETFLTTAKLINYGIDVKKINDLIYNNNDLNRLKLRSFAVNNRMKVIPEKKTAFMWLSTEDLEKFDHKSGYTEGLVNVPLSIKGIELSALMIEQNDIIKISFRSKSDFEVNTFADKYFNGGGHKNAAGGRLSDNLENAINTFEEVLKNTEI